METEKAADYRSALIKLAHLAMKMASCSEPRDALGKNIKKEVVSCLNRLPDSIKHAADILD